MRFSLVALAVVATPLAAQQRAITDTDLYAFRWVTAPQISPDGRQVAYVRVTVNAKHEGYETSIWAVATDGASAPRRLTAGQHDGAPRWSPDSRMLAFLRGGQIYVLSFAGGEAQQLTDMKNGAGPAVWSPDGKSIAFGASVADSADSNKSDVRVITRAVYRGDDEGYFDPTEHAHIWTVPVALGDKPQKAHQVTTGEFDEGNPQWSADGRRIYFVSQRVVEDYYANPDQDLFSVPAAGGAMEIGRAHV